MPDTSNADVVGLPLEDADLLPEFLTRRRPLTLADRRTIIEQAIGLLENVYVHLPVKQFLYGIDPVKRLRHLEARLATPMGSWAKDDLSFHQEMVAVFTECRDMHTGYILPKPFDRSVAFLPFQIEEYYDKNKTRRYLIPRVVADCPEIAAVPSFNRGVEIVGWDGSHIEDAIAHEGERSPGTNEWARHARGLSRLTTRFLAKCLPPDRETVEVTFRDRHGENRTIEVKWRVARLPVDLPSLPDGVPIGQAPHQTLDFETEVFRVLKHELSVRHRKQVLPGVIKDGLLKAELPANFEAFVRTSRTGTAYGYIRIRSFVVNDAERALRTFVRLLGKMPVSGLVIDVRDNPGGSIEAGEMMLQALAARPLDRARLVFRNTPFILRLCELRPDLYGSWLPTLRRAQKTGINFSGGAPLWPDEPRARINRSYTGPIVLIVNALSYSATDFFAAGFQDYDVGPILGVHGSTGGGGANVRTLQSLASEIAPHRTAFTKLWQPKQLPAGADFHVAFRRSIRTGRSAGLEVEDFGVTPDLPVYRMSRRDALEGNPDLFEAAVKHLRKISAPKLRRRPF